MKFACNNCGKNFAAEPEERPAKHALLCGDSTNAEDVARVMGGKKADACITDPPYGVEYQDSHLMRGGDASVHRAYHETAGAEALAFLANLPCDVLVMSYPVDRHLFSLAAALRTHRLELRKELVWVKDTFSFWPGAQYQQRHEPILVIARQGRAVNADVPANESTVLEFPRPRAHELHPTAKPVELWSKLVRYHAPRLVYEPFCGSGTTIVAAEQAGRLCYGIEISPAYVAVSLERLSLMGLEPRQVT
jgi:DNA modification methylase